MPVISRAGVLGTVAATALAGPLALGAASAAAKPDAGDLQLLNGAIAAERAAIKAYTDASASNVLSPPVLAVLRGFLADHSAHLDALSTAVTQAGGTPSTDTASVQTPAALANEADILAFAYTVERLAAGTHLATLAGFKNRDFAKTTGSILGVETTHVALLAEALKTSPPYPSSFVTP